MIGKIIDVTDLEFTYGNRRKKIKAYAGFKELKYNVSILIFSFEDSNELLYANAHLGKDKMVLMKLKDNKEELVLKFIDDLLNGNLNDYEVLDISKIENTEVISYTKIDFDSKKLKALEDKTLEKKVEQEAPINHKKKKKGLKVALILITLMLLCALGSYVFVNQEKIFEKKSRYECSYEYKHDTLNVNVKEIRTIDFTNSRLTNMNIMVDFGFEFADEYYDFKENHKEFEYNIYEKGTVKYLDDKYIVRMFHNNYEDKNLNSNKESAIIEQYKLGKYDCKEIVLEEK